MDIHCIMYMCCIDHMCDTVSTYMQERALNEKDKKKHKSKDKKDKKHKKRRSRKHASDSDSIDSDSDELQSPAKVASKTPVCSHCCIFQICIHVQSELGVKVH